MVIKVVWGHTCIFILSIKWLPMNKNKKIQVCSTWWYSPMHFKIIMHGTPMPAQTFDHNKWSCWRLAHKKMIREVWITTTYLSVYPLLHVHRSASHVVHLVLDIRHRFVCASYDTHNGDLEYHIKERNIILYQKHACILRPQFTLRDWSHGIL